MSKKEIQDLLNETRLLEAKILKVKESFNTRDYAIFITNFQTSLLWLEHCVNTSTNS